MTDAHCLIFMVIDLEKWNIDGLGNKKASKDKSSEANLHLPETSPSGKYFLINEGDTYTNQDQNKLNNQTRIVKGFVKSDFIWNNKPEKIKDLNVRPKRRRIRQDEQRGDLHGWYFRQREAEQFRMQSSEWWIKKLKLNAEWPKRVKKRIV